MPVLFTLVVPADFQPKMPIFIPGLELSERFFLEIVQKSLATTHPNLKYSAALIGEGSEVLGYDTEQSADHCWGPCVMLFLHDGDYNGLRDELLNAISGVLPDKFLGFTTSFDCPHKSAVDIFSYREFFEKYLGVDPDHGVKVSDWLTFPQQKLLEVTSGRIYRDDNDRLDAYRQKFAYYPREVWLYMLSCQWIKISQEEAFLGRCGDVGDELGSQLVAARLIREIARLCFLMEKTYAPYTKWFGTAFSKLKAAPGLHPIFSNALHAKDWKEREAWLAKAYEIVARQHNSLKITKPIDSSTTNYHDRPYLVIHADQFAASIREAIQDEAIKSISTNIGSIDQYADSSDIVEDTEIRRKLKMLY